VYRACHLPIHTHQETPTNLDVYAFRRRAARAFAGAPSAAAAASRGRFAPDDRGAPVGRGAAIDAGGRLSRITPAASALCQARSYGHWSLAADSSIASIDRRNRSSASSSASSYVSGFIVGSDAEDFATLCEVLDLPQDSPQGSEKDLCFGCRPGCAACRWTMASAP